MNRQTGHNLVMVYDSISQHDGFRTCSGLGSGRAL